MRKSVLVMILSLAFVLGTAAQGNAQSSLDSINELINRLKQEQKDSATRLNQIERKIQTIESQKGTVKQDLVTIEVQLNKTQQKLQLLEQQIAQTTLSAQEAAVLLDDATMRVVERDKLLKTRIKIMHEMGEISYLEVLLGAKNIGDFLSRLHAVQLIIKQDIEILEENRNDKILIENKKAEVEVHLSNLQSFYNEANVLKDQLYKQRKERTVVMARLVAEEGELEEIKEEQEQAMLDMMQQMKKALAEKNKLLSIKKYSGGQLAWPVPDSPRVSSYFGLRVDPFTGRNSGHNGLDIPARQGTDIVAAGGGVVIYATYIRGYGNAIAIDHGGDISTLYAHIREGGLFVRDGQEVRKGQKIAEVGSTGRSTGPHLHFGVYKGRTAVDPLGYLKK
jgi:murein DD-endopeptidase MepM/ murein hydrolase activator NlpD